MADATTKVDVIPAPKGCQLYENVTEITQVFDLEPGEQHTLRGRQYATVRSEKDGKVSKVVMDETVVTDGKRVTTKGYKQLAQGETIWATEKQARRLPFLQLAGA